MKFKSIYIILFLFLFQNLYAQKLSVQTGHSSTILDLEYSPDGKYLVSSGMDNKIILWDLRSSKQMNMLSGHNGPVNSITFHPVKNIIASAGDDKTVRLWEYPSGKLLETFDFFTHRVKAVDFNSDGTELACASDSIYIINLKNKTHKTIDKKARKLFYAVTYSNLNKYIAFGGRKERKLYLFNISKDKIVKSSKNHSNNIVIDKKDKYLYSAGNKGNIRRVSINTISAHGKFILPAERSWYSFFAVAINKTLLFAANKNGLIYVYNRKNGTKKNTLKAHKGQVKALSISPDEKFLASAGDDKKIIIWDIENNRIVKILEGGSGSINSISFSENGEKMFIAYDNSNFRIWDLEKKGDIIKGQCPEPGFLEKNERKNYFVSNTSEILNSNNILIKTELKKSDKRTDNFLSSTDNLLIYNPNSETEPILLKSPKNTDYQSFLIADSTTLLVFKNISTHSQKYSLLNWEKIKNREETFYTYAYVYDIKNRTKNSKIRIKLHHKKQSFKIKGDVYYKQLSTDGKSLLVLIGNRKGKSVCKIYDIENENEEQSFTFPMVFQSAGLSPDKNFIYCISGKKDSIYLYNRSNTNLVKSFKGTGPVIFTEDERYCIFSDTEKFLHLFDLKDNKTVYTIPTNHLTNISTIKLNDTYNYIATAGHDGLIKFWDFNTGKNLVSLAAFNESDFMYVTDDNYYYSTIGSTNYINFMMNDHLYSFEQFDVKYNRPDTVLSRLPYSTEAEIEAYHKAYLKRIKKMGFNSNIAGKDFNIPKISIENLNDFKISTTENSITVKYKAQDTKYKLNRVNVWINDIPVSGINGKNISALNTKTYNDSMTIFLSAGKNKIQISAVNSQAYESLKESFYIRYDTEKVSPDLYLISIGVSDYKNSDYDLKYAAKDAGDMTEMFKSDKKYFRKIHTVQIFDKEATIDNIKKTKKLLEESKINDIVIVFYAGHGLLDYDMNYYLATTDINFYNPSENGLKYEMLEDLLNEIPARRKILLIDACHSGEIDKDEIVSENNNAENTTTDTERAGDQRILSQSSFELMKNMFADIRKGTGSTVISSAGGGEFAYESNNTKNGIFTYILINGITTKKADLNKDGKIMVSELRNYLIDNVSKMTKGYQNPTCRRVNLEFDFRIW
ncbi:MAG: caspase family protein [Bacteroidales bacterium]|nr:caspase family protein [Bacteroidales bacterium]